MPSNGLPGGTNKNAVDVQVGEAIRSLRIERERNARSLAEQIGVPVSRLEAIEAGTIRASASELYDIAKVLGTTISDLLRAARERQRGSPIDSPTYPSQPLFDGPMGGLNGERAVLVTIFAPSNVHLLEVAGVRDALFEANCKILFGQPYRIRLVTEDGTPAHSASGVKFVPDASIQEATQPSDTLIVVGPYGVPDPPSEVVTRWLREQAMHSRRYGSTCTGAFLLGHAGLLSSGLCVTTHWQYADRLAADYPHIQVAPDRIFVRDGSVFSSAGVAASIDLAFSLIEEDHGRALALWVARRLVVFLKRPGGQSQFSAALIAQTAATGPIDRVRLHILENPRGDLGLTALAGVAGVTPRHLSRLFQAELGISPAAYVELTGIDIARGLLEGSTSPIKRIAYAAGFGSTATLRRAFLRKIGVTPVEYRLRFQTTQFR